MVLFTLEVLVLFIEVLDIPPKRSEDVNKRLRSRALEISFFWLYINKLHILI
jgi:hypothetical protein